MRVHLWISAVLMIIPVGVTLTFAQVPPASSFEPKMESPETFPDFPGRDETFGFCAACHAFRLVASQGMTRERWDASLAWMSEKHAMPAPEPVERDVILDYLAKAFPPRESAGGRGRWSNPFTPR